MKPFPLDNNQNSNNLTIQLQEGIPWKLHSLIFIIGLIIICTMSYGFYVGKFMVEKYTPLIDATMEIQLEATTAHLWLEEIISGDKFEHIEKVEDNLNQAKWYATAMLEGGENIEGRFIALSDPSLRSEIEIVLEKLNLFHEITLKRYKSKRQSVAGSEIDQQYDTIFLDFINQADKVESKLQAEIKTSTKTYVFIQTVIIFISIALLMLAMYFFHKFERRRFFEIQLLNKTYVKLESALSEIKKLQGIISICSYCKKIIDDQKSWDIIEAHVCKHSGAEFSHGICPDCYKKEMKAMEQ